MRLSKKRCVAACVALVFSGVVGAQTVSVQPPSVNGSVNGGPTDPPSVALVFDAGTGATSIGFDVTFDPAVLTLVPTTNPAVATISQCQIVSPGVLRYAASNIPNAQIASNTVCNVAISVIGTAGDPAPVGNYPLTITALSAQLTGSTNGNVNVQPLLSPIVAFTPDGAAAAPGTPITFSAAGSASITAAVSSADAGDTGGTAASVASCALSGPDAAAFNVASPAFPINFPAGEAGSQAIGLTCSRTATNQTATLTCAVSDRGGSRSEVYALTCPGAVPAAVTLNPNGGAFALPGGLIGNNTSRNIVVSVPTAGETGGGNATVTCTGPAPFTITGSPVSVAPGSTTGGSIAVGCPLEASESLGDITCAVVDAAGTRNVVFNAVCPAGSTTPPTPQPSVIPASSTWSQALLILLLAGLGMAFVGFRRS